jgi:hypothetical protein
VKEPCCRLVVAALCLALAAPATASVWDFQWGVSAPTELVTPTREPAERTADMQQLQERLVARQVPRALRAPAVVEVTRAERRQINDLGPAEMKYLVGVAKPTGLAVDFAPARALGTRTAPLGFGAARGTGDGGFVWTGVVNAPDATALRLHVTGLDLPQGAELFVYNLRDQAFGPYTGRGPLGDGELHTHTVFGNQILLQLRQPPGTEGLPRLTVGQVGVMGQRFAAPRFGAGDGGRGDWRTITGASHAFCSRNAACVENAACHSSNVVNGAKGAVASMLFLSGANYYICTGSLLVDSDTSSVIPYFLTANHCVSKAAEASSLETYFNYKTTCSNPDCTQPYNNDGDTIGATILSTSSTSDYTLMQLSSTPSTASAYLGWNTNAVANSHGVALYRISHPKGSPQAYSEHSVDTSKPTCRTWPRGNWIYSKDTFGATEGGSSGSPVVNGAGEVVGQLSGACGFNVNDSCDAASNATVDGAFAAYFSQVESWLGSSGGGGGGGGSCTLGAKGDSCTANSDCCSNKCTGKAGAKTCK